MSDVDELMETEGTPITEEMTGLAENVETVDMLPLPIMGIALLGVRDPLRLDCATAIGTACVLVTPETEYIDESDADVTGAIKTELFWFFDVTGALLAEIVLVPRVRVGAVGALDRGGAAIAI